MLLVCLVWTLAWAAGRRRAKTHSGYCFACDMVSWGGFVSGFCLVTDVLAVMFLLHAWR